MALFVILGLMTVAALALLVVPLLRGHGAIAPRADYDIEIYRDQLAELGRDVERGVIDADEQASARTEIQRRILAADSATQDKPATNTGGSGILAAFAIMMALPLAAGSLYLGLGSPGVVDRPFADRPAVVAEAAPPLDANADVATMVAGLAARLEDEPDDLEGWLMLARSYVVLESYDEAVAAMERARKLDGEDPDILASLAENRVFAADGMVTPAAVADFEMLQTIDRSHPAARFYLGMAHLQAGENQLAFDEWTAFARQSPADAPWMAALREQITRVSGMLGVPVPDGLEGMAVAAAGAPATTAPGPTADDIAAAQSMSAGEQSAMIRAMVARLAGRLEDEPGDIEGWRRLAKAYGVLGETDLAADAYARAAEQIPGDLALLTEFAEAITHLAPEDAPLPPQAVDVFRKIIALDENSPVALWHLGLAAAEASNGDEARGFWSRLLALIPAGSNDRNAIQRAIDSL